MLTTKVFSTQKIISFLTIFIIFSLLFYPLNVSASTSLMAGGSPNYDSGPNPNVLVSVANNAAFTGNSVSLGEISVCFDSDSGYKEFIQSVPSSLNSPSIGYIESRSVLLSPATYTVTVSSLVVSSADASLIDDCATNTTDPESIFWSGDLTLSSENSNVTMIVGGNETNPEVTIDQNVSNRVFMSENYTPWSEYSASGSALSPVTMEKFNGKVFQSIRGTDNNIYTRSSEDNGLTWNTWTPFGATLERVSMINDGNELFQSVRGTDSQIYTRRTEDGENWSGWEHSGATLSEVSMVMNGRQLIQTVRGTDNNIYTRVWLGNVIAEGWTPSGATFNKVESISYRNRVYQAVRGTDNAVYIRYSLNPLANEWSNWTYITNPTNNEIIRTGSDPSLYVHNNSLYISTITQNFNLFTFSHDGNLPAEFELVQNELTDELIGQVNNSGIDFVRVDGSEVYNHGIRSLTTFESFSIHKYYPRSLEESPSSYTEISNPVGPSKFPAESFAIDGNVIQTFISANNVIYTRTAPAAAG